MGLGRERGKEMGGRGERGRVLTNAFLQRLCIILTMKLPCYIHTKVKLTSI